MMKVRQISYICTPNAEVAQSVEHQLPKLRVAGSNPVFRSRGPFRRAFLLGDIAQYETNDSVCQSHAGSFCLCAIAKGCR